MRGTKKTLKRKISPDPKFASVKIAKFINYLMRRGKKTVAQAVMYRALDLLAKKNNDNPLDIFEKAIKNVAPTLEVKSRRVGGANYQIPLVVSNDRKLVLAYRWLIAAAQSKKGRPMAEKLAAEFLAAANNEGEAVKKKEDTHRMAEANKAFAHFA